MDLLLLLPIAVSFAGLYMLVKLRFFFLRHPIRTAKKFLGALRRKGSFGALSLALAGTLGVGNIFGVSIAIINGGAGAVFWMLISSVFSCVIKYSEVIISHDSEQKKLGMISVIAKSFGRRGGFFAAVYASLAILLSLVMGCMLQSRSVGSAMCDVLGTNNILTAVFFILCVAAAVFGGNEKIQKILSKILPLTTVIYIFMTSCVIFGHFSHLPEALAVMIKGAFSFRSFSSGVGISIFLTALKEGYVGGMLSNEAGVGTSSFGHGVAVESTPVESGLLGAFEVFFDTGVVCMLTALAILTAVPNYAEYTSAMLLITDAIASSFGYTSAVALVGCVFFFAFSTVICWFYYGNLCVEYLFGRKFSRIFAVAFFVFIALGIFSADKTSVRLADTVLVLMSLPTLISVIKSSDRIVTLSENENMFSKGIKASGCASKRRRRQPRILKQNHPRS